MLRIAFALAVTSLLAPAADWPQYRGPAGNGTTPDKISTNWSGGPRVLWKVPGGTGFSSFAVAGNRCFTLEGRDEGGLEDRRASRDIARGNPVWTRDIMKENAGRNVMWKNAASPLVESGLVYVAGGGAGQSFLALNPKDGAVVAKSGDDTMTHATPIAATILGQRQVIFFTKTGLTALEPKSLKQLWHADFPFNVSTAASPVVIGDLVYCSAGYTVGAAAFKISKTGLEWGAEQVQRWPGDKPLANHWSTPVLHDGHLYGMYQFKQYGKGPIKCVSMPSGEEKWEKGGFGPGHAVLANGNLVALSDTGDLVVIAAKPDGYSELARAKVIDGKC